MSQQAVGLPDNPEAGFGKGNAQEVVHENRGAYGQRIAFPRVFVQVGMAHGFVGGADAEQKQENAAGQAGKRASSQQRKGEGQGVKGERDRKSTSLNSSH